MFEQLEEKIKLLYEKVMDTGRNGDFPGIIKQLKELSRKIPRLEETEELRKDLITLESIFRARIDYNDKNTDFKKYLNNILDKAERLELADGVHPPMDGVSPYLTQYGVFHALSLARHDVKIRYHKLQHKSL